MCNCHRAGKRKLGPRKNANRHSSILRRSKPACASTKVTCSEFVANLCRPRPDVLKAVVTHLWNSPVGKPDINALAVLPHHKLKAANKRWSVAQDVLRSTPAKAL